jgi:hypothetical protein
MTPEELSDLIFSIGTARPTSGGLDGLLCPNRTDQELKSEQERFDRVTAEIERGYASMLNAK